MSTKVLIFLGILMEHEMKNKENTTPSEQFQNPL